MHAEFLKMFAQVFFIVWRESIEALLVIGILHAWLSHNEASGAKRYLWGGVLAGLAGSVALSFVLTHFSAALPPEGQEYFQFTVVMIAAVLIVQMVFWMRRHGANLKRHLQGQLAGHISQGHLWGVFGLALIAVMREGTETVIFLHGIIGASQDAGSVSGGVAFALATALASYALLQLGGKFLSWRLFFQFTEAMLLLLACALFVSGSGLLVSLGLLPYTPVLWDSSALIDDMSRIGGILASLTGYRAMPDATTVMTWIMYWSGIAFAFHLQASRKPAVERDPA